MSALEKAFLALPDCKIGGTFPKQKPSAASMFQQVLSTRSWFLACSSSCCSLFPFLLSFRLGMARWGEGERHDVPGIRRHRESGIFECFLSAVHVEHLKNSCIYRPTWRVGSLPFPNWHFNTKSVTSCKHLFRQTVAEDKLVRRECPGLHSLNVPQMRKS